MTKKVLALRILALVLCIVAVILLLIPHTGKVNVELRLGTKEISEDASYNMFNFFEAAERLFDEGFVKFGLLATMITLGLSFAALIASFFVKFLRKFYWAVLPLLLVIATILAHENLDHWYVIDYNYLGTYLGLAVREETSIRFYFDLIPSIILFGGMFVSTLVSSLLEGNDDRKKAACLAAEAACEAEMSAVTDGEHVSVTTDADAEVAEEAPCAEVAEEAPCAEEVALEEPAVAQGEV